jgi:hypothetical protein
MCEAEFERHEFEGQDVYDELLSQASYWVSRAFESMSVNGPHVTVDLVQIDNSTIEGINLFSVLLTEKGGKGDSVERIRLLAFPSDPLAASDLRYAAQVVSVEGELPFKTDKFIIEHTVPLPSGNTDYRLSQLTPKGLTELLSPEQSVVAVQEEGEPDFDGFLRIIVAESKEDITETTSDSSVDSADVIELPFKSKPSIDRTQSEEQTTEMMLYAFTLEDKLSFKPVSSSSEDSERTTWQVIPQN